MIRALAREGVPVGVNFAPVIPALNDHELDGRKLVVNEAKERKSGGGRF